MTLVITSLSHDVVTQVSDRKLTYPNGRVASDKATKAVCVSCTDAMFSIAYTGLARVGTTDRAPRTDRWLVDYLTESRAAEKRCRDIIEGLRAHAVNTFSKLSELGKWRGITFVFAGLGRPGVFAGCLSNQEDSNGKWLAHIDNAFEVNWYFRNDRPMRRLDFLIHGAEKAITPELKTAIAKIRRRYFNRSAKKQVEVFVDVLRRASLHRTAGYLIGRDCMSTTIMWRGFFTDYHPANVDSLAYMPHYVGPQFTMRDGWTATDDEAAERARRNWRNR
jgi:hypothetical protein